VAFKKSAASAGPRVWTVAELGAFYTEHRSELLTHANRVLKDSAKAEEITQDALIKFMLAAPLTNHLIFFTKASWYITDNNFISNKRLVRSYEQVDFGGK